MSKRIRHDGLEPKVLVKVLKGYKKNPCLWDTTHEHYHNKSIKSAIWEELLKEWRRVDPKANQYDLKNRIFHMRTNYTRTRKKLESCAEYKPTLWYYKYMNFLSGKKDNDSDKNSDSSPDENDETLYIHIPREHKRRASESIDLDKPETDPSMATVEASAAAFGQSVGAQLQHLNKVQRCIAEKLISDVIYHAKMEQLTTNSSLNVSQTQPLHTSIIIPKSEPSWYEQESASSYTFLTDENGTTKSRDQQTNSAATSTKIEYDESPNGSNDSQDYLDEQMNAIDSIDIVKDELN